jgi:glycosyltransferase involved in cell wall biosynthesis
MPRLSIIIPVYNVENYLSKCVDSILAQTFIDFECILIDDGSTDNSGKLCDQYAKKDDRIIVIHQKNSGPSSARNAGLDNARGEWIGFVDSDDWCDINMFSQLYENSIKNNADVSVCGWKRINQSNIKTYIQEKDYIYDCQEAVNAMFSNKYFSGYIWNKLIKARFFSEYNIRFDINITPFEETLVLYQILKLIKKAVYLPVPCYNYNINPNSITNKSPLTWFTALPAFEKMSSLETSKIIKQKIFLKKIEMVSYVCYAEITNYKDSAYAVFLEIAKKHILYILFLPGIPLKDRISRCLCLLYPKTYIYFQRYYRKIKQSIMNKK